MTREDFRAILVAHDACTSGLAAFDAATAEEVAPFLNWTAAAQLAAITGPLRAYIGWAWASGVMPMWSMRGANLAGAYLVGADLDGAYLARADLAGADLAGAYLVGADLVGADLRWVNLAGASLTGAIMPAGWEAVVAYRPDGSRGAAVEGDK